MRAATLQQTFRTGNLRNPSDLKPNANIHPFQQSSSSWILGIDSLIDPWSDFKASVKWSTLFKCFSMTPSFLHRGCFTVKHEHEELVTGLKEHQL